MDFTVESDASGNFKRNFKRRRLEYGRMDEQA
jgi:hypothetical protein